MSPQTRTRDLIAERNSAERPTTLPFITALDLPALTDAQLVATVRTLDEAGLDALRGTDLELARRLLSDRAVKHGIAFPREELEVAYTAISNHFFGGALFGESGA